MINIKENEQLSKLNHSGAHLLAHAVKRLYPNALFWVGPVISEGFYYDIDLGTETITENDFEKIEREMKKIVKSDKRITRIELSKEEAIEMFKDNPYKVDLINEMPENEIITAYKQDEFADLCRGPHVETTKQLKHTKLLKVSGAYYKGDSKNKVLQRIYGIAFENEEDLQEHLKFLEEAKKRDHRKLGKDLDLFMHSELVGQGLPLYLPNGTKMINLLKQYIAKKEEQAGYDHVCTPVLGTSELYKISGHWDHYKEDMFPKMERDGEEFVLRPMNCPHHMLVYKNNLHSYRDLPIRIGELAQDFRFESSGSVIGIERVRTFCQNDAHLFVTLDQIEEEFSKVVKLILDVYEDFGIKADFFRLSLRDPQDTEKYYQDDEMWDKAENMLRRVLNNLGIEYKEAIGEAAFYGPKLDVQVKSVIGHEVSLSTCQLDFLLPEKFDLTYVSKDGSKERPIVIHRAILGSIDRFLAYIIEQFNGAFPLWLSPTQVSIIPVNNNYHLNYSKQLVELLKLNDIRVQLDDREEKLGYKIRETQTKKIPLTLVIGDNEITNDNVSYRRYGTEETKTLTKDEFIKLIKEEINQKLR